MEASAIVFRVGMMYVFMLVMVRLSGKRSLGDLAAPDFVVTLILGDMFDDIFWLEVPVLKGVVGVSTILLVHAFFSYLLFRSALFDRWFQGRGAPVIQQGRIRPAALRKLHLPETDLRSLMRRQGEEDIEVVESAFLEPVGDLSIQKIPAARTAQKQDLPALRRLLR